MKTEPRIHFVATQQDGAEKTAESLRERYGSHDIENADVIVALGGDGFMLRTLHRHLPTGLPVYGMKLGDVGFLMNRFREDDLYERLGEANVVELNPLRMIAVTEGGGESQALAINEVSLFRQTRQSAAGPPCARSLGRNHTATPGRARRHGRALRLHRTGNREDRPGQPAAGHGDPHACNSASLVHKCCVTVVR